MSVRKQLVIFKHESRAKVDAVCEALRKAGLDAYVLECPRCKLYHVQSAMLIDFCAVETRSESL